ncbi:hypothetical protein [Caulobacter sp. B11]|uniref:hypothetical protein n=1 Tax=Caulobacter sp. B11 TaxID=2048899 RepID=UPI001F2710B8|nr:hypothetical protein [Caulobacter sp. B11]
MRTARLLIVLLASLTLAACGSLPRTPFTATEITGAAPQGMAEIRFNASDAAVGFRFVEAARARETPARPSRCWPFPAAGPMAPTGPA